MGTSRKGPPNKAQEALKGVIEACDPRGEAVGGAMSKIGVEGTNRQGPPKKAQEALKGEIKACGSRGKEAAGGALSKSGVEGTSKQGPPKEAREARAPSNLSSNVVSPLG